MCSLVGSLIDIILRNTFSKYNDVVKKRFYMVFSFVGSVRDITLPNVISKYNVLIKKGST